MLGKGHAAGYFCHLPVSYPPLWATPACPPTALQWTGGGLGSPGTPPSFPDSTGHKVHVPLVGFVKGSQAMC